MAEFSYRAVDSGLVRLGKIKIIGKECRREVINIQLIIMMEIILLLEKKILSSKHIKFNFAKSTSE